MKAYFFLVLIACSLVTTKAQAAKCQEVRAGFDIGSGSTKMLVAKIDYCQKKILEVLLNESRKVSYNDDLAKSTDGKLSQEIVNDGLKTLQELYQNTLQFKPKKYYGVATSVFRKAANGAEVIKSFSRHLKVKLELISQEEEALLGYQSALALLDEKELAGKNLVVWDIGGGSMQMVSLDEKKKTVLYLGELASVTFKNMIVDGLQFKDSAQVSTPNPIGNVRAQAVGIAKSYAKIHVPEELKKIMKNAYVVGVGGVHGNSLKHQLNLKTPEYSLEALTKLSAEQVKKADKDLAGEYRATDVSNLLLVQGFMEALGVNSVRVVEASLLQGVVLK